MNKVKFEAYQLGIYCDTVYMILTQHRDLSIAKLIFFAYAINKARFFNKDVYTANNTKNIVNKAISIINGDFEGYADAIPYIVKSIHILIQAQKIKVEGKIIHLIDSDFYYAQRNKESKFMHTVIDESKSWSDKRFMREVLHNV